MLVWGNEALKVHVVVHEKTGKHFLIIHRISHFGMLTRHTSQLIPELASC